MQFSKHLQALALGSAVLSADAGVIFTIEGPGAQASSVSGVTTETFDSFPTGPIGPAATAVGNLSAGGTIYDADVFGGAEGTRFFRPNSGSATLTLDSPQNYLGLWWSAGDASNFLDLYDGASLLDTVAVGDIISVVDSAYFGNPNGGGNAGEPYAYLNFTTTDGSQISSVVFRGGNFELDNVSVTDAIINPPGTLPDGEEPPITVGVPDGGSTLALLLLGSGGYLLANRRTSRH